LTTFYVSYTGFTVDEIRQSSATFGLNDAEKEFYLALVDALNSGFSNGLPSPILTEDIVNVILTDQSSNRIQVTYEIPESYGIFVNANGFDNVLAAETQKQPGLASLFRNNFCLLLDFDGTGTPFVDFFSKHKCT
jgi:hypothetical protein